MAVYCVCYTIGETGDHTPDGPRDKLGALGDVCELTPSTWLLDTTLHTGGILTRLEGVLGSNDQLVVFEVAKQGDWSITQGPQVTQEGVAVWCERHIGMS